MREMKYSKHFCEMDDTIAFERKTPRGQVSWQKSHTYWAAELKLEVLEYKAYNTRPKDYFNMLTCWISDERRPLLVPTPVKSQHQSQIFTPSLIFPAA